MRFLVAPNGAIWNPAVGLFHQRPVSGCQAGPLDTADLIVLEASDQRIHAKFRLDALTPENIEGLLRLVIRRDARRIVIELSDTDFVAQIFHDVEDLAAWLFDLRDGAAFATEDQFSAEILDIQRVRAPGREAVAHHYRYWKSHAGTLPQRFLQRIVKQPTRFAELFVRINSDDQTTPLTWPRYLRLYEPKDPQLYLDKPFDEHGEQSFLQLMTAGYLETDRLAQPRLEMVDAYASPPRGPRRRLRYERLLLPWRTAGGERLISIIPYRRSKIVLPGVASQRSH